MMRPQHRPTQNEDQKSDWTGLQECEMTDSSAKCRSWLRTGKPCEDAYDPVPQKRVKAPARDDVV